MKKKQSTTIFPPGDMIPLEYRLGSPIEQRHYLCAGELKEWSGPQQEVVSPLCEICGDTVTQKVIGSYPLLTEEEAMATLDAACKAYDHGQGEWPTMPVGERISRVAAFVDQMEEKRDVIVKLLMWEIGKTLADAEKEFDRTVEYIEDTLEAVKDLDRNSSGFVREKGVLAQIRRVPLGVVLCMGPFNYPLNETFTTLIPAIIMGNTVIFKPAKLGVLLHHPLLEAFRDCFPAGVVNTVYGDGQKVISPLMKSAQVDVLAFIGSSRVAGILKQQHPKPHRLRSILGLEAKNAAIVLKDADLQQAVKECVSGSLANNGQRCTALKIIFVHKDIVDTFLAQFCDEVDRLSPGMPWDKGCQITPLPEPHKTAYLKELIDDACDKGAHVVNKEGGLVDHTFMSPAVVYPVKTGMRLYAEEQFGPVVPIATFSEIEEPIEYVTLSNYGQQVSIFGKDPNVIAALVDPLVNQVCRVNINSQCQRGPDSFPFTGRKDSAEGTLSVSDALRAFSIRTLVAAKDTDENIRLVNSIIKERRSRFLSSDYTL